MMSNIHIDEDTKILIGIIENYTDDQEFSLVCTALEAVLARRLMREQGGEANSFFFRVAGSMIADHIMHLLDCKDLLDG